jgi:hypothetical protein
MSFQLNIPFQIIIIVIPGLFISGILVGGNWNWADAFSITLWVIGIAGGIGFTILCLFTREKSIVN